MASWTDGPEYAPVERPDVFVAPDAAPLASDAADAGAPAAVSTPPPAAPTASPPAFRPAPDAVALAELAAPVSQKRDPREAFDVVTTPLTSWQGGPTEPLTGVPPAGPPTPGPFPGAPLSSPPTPPMAPLPGTASAWGAAHARSRPAGPPPATWAPDQPFPAAPLPPPTHYPAPGRDWPPPQVNPADFPPPDASPWHPAMRGPHPEAPQPVTLERVVSAVTPGVLISLGLGVLIGTLSGLLYFMAWLLASRVRYRRGLVARVFSLGAFGILGLGFWSMLSDYGRFDVFVWYDASVVFAQFANLVVGVVVLLVVRTAIARGEPPEPDAGR